MIHECLDGRLCESWLCGSRGTRVDVKKTVSTRPVGRKPRRRLSGRRQESGGENIEIAVMIHVGQGDTTEKTGVCLGFGTGFERQFGKLTLAVVEEDFDPVEQT